MRRRPLNILIVYVANRYPMRATLWDQLYSFRRYSDHNCFYLNLTVRRVPWYLKHIKFDLIVFGTLFLAVRVVDEWFREPRQKVLTLKSFDAVKIAFPQDEYVCTDVLMDFIQELGIDCVFSLAPESEWPKIYDRLDPAKVKLVHVLTGYLNDTTLARIRKLALQTQSRDIDLGYRTYRAAASLGRHGLLRQQLADLFQQGAPRYDLTTNISTRPEDILWGDDWYKFLLRCKYTISAEGGASILDRDGSIQRKTEQYLLQNPGASFDEIEAACFAGLDGSLLYVAISPRHLEACATRTCQVLVEGEYNGVLIAGRHYLELKRDFSNLEELLSTIKEDRLREQIVANAHQDVVESGKYTYRAYVDLILREALPQVEKGSARAKRTFLTWLIHEWMRASDCLGWIQVALGLHTFRAQARNKMRRLMVALLSEERVLSLLKRVRQSGSK